MNDELAAAGSEYQVASFDGEQRVYGSRVVDEELVHREQMFDDEGELIYSQELPMQYVVGSGRRRTFINMTRCCSCHH